MLHKVHEASSLKRASVRVTGSSHKQMQFSEAAKIGNKHQTSGATVSQRKKGFKRFYLWFKDQKFTPILTPASFFFCVCSIFLSRLWNLIIIQGAAKSSSRGVSISGLMTNDLRRPLYANDERLNKSPCVQMSTLPHRLPSAFPTAASLLYSHSSGNGCRTAHLLLDIVFQFFVAPG